MLVFGGTQNCLGMAHASFNSSWRSSMRHIEWTKGAWPIGHAGRFMREDYTTDTVCGTSSESPLRSTQESGSGVESIREYTGTTYRMEQAALRYRHSAYQLGILSLTHHWSGNLVNRDKVQAWTVEESEPLGVSTLKVPSSYIEAIRSA